jgi:hypothetical protein
VIAANRMLDLPCSSSLARPTPYHLPLPGPPPPTTVRPSAHRLWVTPGHSQQTDGPVGGTLKTRARYPPPKVAPSRIRGGIKHRWMRWLIAPQSAFCRLPKTTADGYSARQALASSSRAPCQTAPGKGKPPSPRQKRDHIGNADFSVL